MAATVIQPRFMARSACLAAECPDSCCRDWNIDVDPATERYFRGLADGSWRPRFFSAQHRSQIPSAGRCTLIIRLRLDGLRPFVDRDGLCGRHKAFGTRPYRAPVRSFPS